MAAAEWHNRRLFARLDCEDEDDDEGCEDVGKVNCCAQKHLYETSDLHQPSLKTDLLQVNTAYVVKTTEAFKQWEYRSENGNGKGKKRRGDESRIIDDDDDDDDEDEEERVSPVVEESTCPFKKSKEEEEEEEDEVGETVK